MHWSFYIVAALTIGSGIAAMSLRNIVHCALVLTVTFAGLVEVMRTWTRYWLEIVELPGDDEADGHPV